MSFSSWNASLLWANCAMLTVPQLSCLVSPIVPECIFNEFSNITLVILFLVRLEFTHDRASIFQTWMHFLWQLLGFGKVIWVEQKVEVLNVGWVQQPSWVRLWVGMRFFLTGMSSFSQACLQLLIRVSMHSVVSVAFKDAGIAIPKTIHQFLNIRVCLKFSDCVLKFKLTMSLACRSSQRHLLSFCLTTAKAMSYVVAVQSTHLYHSHQLVDYYVVRLDSVHRGPSLWLG